MNGSTGITTGPANPTPDLLESIIRASLQHEGLTFAMIDGFEFWAFRNPEDAGRVGEAFLRALDGKGIVQGFVVKKDDSSAGWNIRFLVVE
jgi:hypothetical protein